MPSQFDALITLIGFPVIVIGGTLGANYWRSSEALHVIENTVRSMPFTLSCEDGNLDGADARNCLERGGYRLVRVGMGSIIAHIGQDGASTVVYRSGTDNDTFGGALSRAAWSIKRNER